MTLLIAAVLSASAAEAEEGWQVIKNHAFSFSAPKGFKAVPIQGIDSYVGEYQGDGITLTFDYGWYTNKMDDWGEGTKYEEIKLGDDPARLAIQKRVVGPGAGTTLIGIYLKRGKEQNALGMTAVCRSEQEVALARKILLSVRLAPAAKPGK